MGRLAEVRKETSRLYGVLNKHLSDGRDFICGNQYTIADMASYPWVVPHERQQQDLAKFPALAKWFARIHDRPATVKAYEIAAQINQNKTVDEASKKILFGQDASSVK